MLFGKKKSPDRTFLVLDIESGSVGGALVRTSVAHAPKLFGEERSMLPVEHSRDTHSLLQHVGGALQQVVQHLGAVAARLRDHDYTQEVGQVERAVVFLSAPWGAPDLALGTPYFNADAQRDINQTVEAHFGIPTTFHTHASAALHGARALLPYEDTYLLCMPTGEVTEMLSVEQGAVRSYATLPLGRHTMLRTLRAHGGLTLPEARSALRLSAAHLHEPLRAAQELLAAAFIPAANDLAWHRHERVYVVSHDGAWLARALSESSASKLFPAGATLKNLHGLHASPHIAQHAASPDLPLLLNGLFVDTHYR